VSLRGSGPVDELSVPSGTTVEEHDLVTDGDVLVGAQSTVDEFDYLSAAAVFTRFGASKFGCPSAALA
jgi:hypothetical protein